MSNEPNAISERISALRSSIDGQVSDRNRVIDYLLDMRNDFASPGLVAAIDELLVDVPGLTVVENTWWSGALDTLCLAAEPTGV